MDRVGWLLLALAVSALLAACGDEGGGEPGADVAADVGGGPGGDVPATPDVPLPDAAMPDVPAAPDVPVSADGPATADVPAGPDVAADVPPDAAPTPGPFPWELPSTAALAPPEGFVIARTIAHLHSIYSHDACDNLPVLEDGTPNEACLNDLRAALCADRVDVAFMTEHYDLAARTPDFTELFLQREGDTWVDEDGHHAANAIHCADGHTVLILPGLEGGEGQVSPLGAFAHPIDGTPAEVEAAWQDDSFEGVQRLRAVGAVPAAIHIEGQDPLWLADTDLDALEIGNLHVLIHPGYRSDLGLDPATAAKAFVDYLLKPAQFPAPDLVFLEFHERMPLYQERWDALLGERMIAGFLGNDAHRNVAPPPLADGERADSYRRMMKWYANHLLLTEKTPAAAREALRRGRLAMVFEVLGSPVGFDFRVERDGAAVGRMGDVVESGGDPGTLRLRVTAPRALLDGTVHEVPLALRVYRVTPEGSAVVAETDDGALDLPAPGTGRYRIELDMTPTHLVPWLMGRADLVHPYPWIYSNPIEIR